MTEEKKEYYRNYYHKNKEKIQKRSKIYRDSNPDRRKEIYTKSWLKNKEKRIVKHKEWLRTLKGCLCYKLYHLKKAKRSRKLEVNINIEFILTLWEKQNGKCAISNYPMIYNESNLFGVSIDRINPKFGYLKNNVQLVCQGINFCKNKYTNNEVIEFWNYKNNLR